MTLCGVKVQGAGLLREAVENGSPSNYITNLVTDTKSLLLCYLVMILQLHSVTLQSRLPPFVAVVLLTERQCLVVTLSTSLLMCR